MPRQEGHYSRLLDTRSARARAWQSMRILRTFTMADLQATAEIGHDNVGRFVRALTATGFLRIARQKLNGSKGGHQVYQLVRNTGPHTPRIQADGGVWDPNTHDVFYGE